MTHRRDFGERVFRALLVVYPREFRRRFGEEMVEFFLARRVDQRRRGSAATIRFWLHLVADIAINAPTLHVHAAAARVRGVHPATSRDVPWSSPEYPEETRPMDKLLQDIRYAFRTLARRPGFVAVSALTLAIGIGATTAIYSVVNAVLVQPLPWPGGDRLLTLTGMRDGQPAGTDYLDYLDWRAQNRSFEELAAIRGQSVNLTGVDKPERLFGSFVTAGAFRFLGAQPERGRFFTDQETEVATKQPVAVVSYGFWQSHLGASPDAIGRTLILNGQTLTIVGITRQGLQGPQGNPDVWMPIGYYPNKGELDTRGRPSVAVFGRLKPGVTIDQARADLNAIASRIADAYPATNKGITVGVQDLKANLVGSTRTELYIVLGAVALVLLIACGNVANLQLTRAAARRRELTVRSALGAARGRLVRQLVTENLLLSIIGGALGIVVALAGTRWLGTVVPRLLTSFSPVALNAQVLIFATAITLGTGLFFALPPAMRASRVKLNDALGTRTASGNIAGGNGLVFAQVALCVLLLVTSGLLSRSLVALTKVNPGFDADHVLTMQFRLPPAKYDSEDRIAATFDQMLGQLKAVPGVTNAALVRATPLNGNGSVDPYQLEGQQAADPSRLPTLQTNIVTPGYFETMRIPRVAGRDFDANDRIGAMPVAVVNAQLASKISPNGSALGKRIRIPNGADMSWFTVVGVVGNTKHFTVGEAQLDQLYVPIAQRPLIFTEVVLRAQGEPLGVVPAARQAIWNVDRDQPVWGIRPLVKSLNDGLGARQFILYLLVGFAVIAVLLAMIGIYGVTSYSVAGRSQEMGIRLALGARTGQVIGLVVSQSMKVVGGAIVLGLVVSVGATRLIQSQLFGVSAGDPLVYLVVPIVLGLIALLACLLPARRASRVDPVSSLRAE
jgi:putative ABC transport system permease protein